MHYVRMPVATCLNNASVAGDIHTMASPNCNWAQWLVHNFMYTMVVYTYKHGTSNYDSYCFMQLFYQS